MSLESNFKAMDKANERRQKQYEKELLSAYQKSLKEIRSQIALAYEKYGGDFAEMQKYNRLTNLEKQIAKEIGKLTSKNAMTLKKGIGETFEDSYYRTAYVIEKEVQAKLGYSLLNKKSIESAINNPLDRVGFLQRNRDNQQRLTRQLKEQLTQGLIQGESYQKTAKRIKERMDVGATNVQRIANTEMHRAQSQGRLDSLIHANEKGVKMRKRWISSLDGSTRDSHQDLDGVTIPLDENFEGEEGSGPAPGQMGSAAEDINCRCTMISVIDGYEPQVRRAREVEGQKGEIIGYKNYNEWKAGRIK